MKAPTAFLSHSSRDVETAEKLARDLREAGVVAWYSPWEIKPGDSLRRKLDDGIDKATHFLVLLTPSSLRSEWVQTELDAGLVSRISGKCRLIPMLFGIDDDAVPATLRGILWVRLEPYDSGLRQLIDACHEVSIAPPVGPPPAWASERPLGDVGLSPNAQRIVTWINQSSELGIEYDYFERDPILAALDLKLEQAGIAASELEEAGLVACLRDSGSGRAGFSQLKPLPALFLLTDPVLRGWDPAKDAVRLAAAMVNSGREDVSIEAMAKNLSWGPRRLNPAADFLRVGGYVGASSGTGPAPYTYSHALVTFRTRWFCERGGLSA